MAWISQGDALERLREMPDESVQCCVRLDALRPSASEDADGGGPFLRSPHPAYADLRPSEGSSMASVARARSRSQGSLRLAPASGSGTGGTRGECRLQVLSEPPSARSADASHSAPGSASGSLPAIPRASVAAPRSRRRTLTATGSGECARASVSASGTPSFPCRRSARRDSRVAIAVAQSPPHCLEGGGR